jgi:hypothetical protein
MAMDDTGGSGGNTQVEGLAINVAVPGGKEAPGILDGVAKSADNLATVSVKTMSSVAGLESALEKAAAQYEATRGSTKNLTDAQLAQHQANKLALEIAQERYDQGTRYLAQLDQMVATFNMTTDELQRYKAAQLGVSQEAEVYISQMKSMRDATAQYGVVIKEVAEIEKARLDWETASATALNAQRIRSLSEQAALEESSSVALNAQRKRALSDQAAMEESASTSLNAQRTRALNDQATLEESAMTALNAQRVRALNDQAALEESATTSLNAQRVRALNDQARLEESAQTALNAQRIRMLNEQAAAEESAMAALNAQRIRAVNDQKALEESAQTSLNAQRIRETNEQAAKEESARTALNAQRIRETTAAAKAAADAEKAAQEEMQRNQTIFNAFKIRTLNENRVEGLRIREQMAKDAAALAEKQAEDEIRWNMLSVKTRITQLQMLQQYIDNPKISQKTTEDTFSSAAFKDLPNLDALIKQYNDSLSKHSKTLDEATPKAKGWGDALSNNRVRTEALVLAHEALQGRFTRMPGSLMVMGEYLTSAGIGMGAMMGTALSLAAAIGFVGYEMERGYKQTKEFNDAINRTNGYSGETTQSLEALAQSVGKVHGEYTEAYKAAALLTSSGKFTKDQVDMITQSAADLSHAFGQDVNTTIKEFETLVVRSTTSGAAGMLQVSKAVEKLDEQYHFLTVQQMQHIIQLEKEGQVREASALAIKLFGEETQKEAKNAEEYIGWVEQAWNGVTRAIKGTIQAIADIGKKDTFANQEKTLLNQLEKNADGSLKTDEAHMSQTNKYRLQAYYALEQEISNYNQKAADQADKEQKAAVAKHNLEARAIEDVRLMKKTQTELQDALDRNAKQKAEIVAADPTYLEDPKNVQYEADRVQAIIKAHTDKTRQTISDGRKQELINQLNADEQSYKLAQEAADNQIKMAKEYADQHITSRQSEYDAVTDSYNRELKAAQDMEAAKLATLESYKPKNKTDAEETVKRINDVKRAYELAAAEINDAKQKDQQAIIGKGVKEVSLVDDKELNKLQTQIDNLKKYNAEVGKTAEEKKLALAQLDDEALIQAQIQLVLEQSKVDNEQLGAVEQAQADARIEKLNAIIAKLREKKDLEGTGAQLEAQAAADKLWADQNKKLENDIASAIIDGGGRGWKKLIRDMELAFAKLILQPIIAPVAGSISSILNPTATQAGGVAGADAAGGMGSYLGAANAAASAYKFISSGLTGMVGGVGSLVTQAGNLLGSSNLAAFGSGMSMTAEQSAAAAGAYADAGMTGISSSIGAGAAIAPYLALGAGALGGHMIGGAISGQYGSESTVNTSEAAGAAIGTAMAGPIGAAIGSFLGGTVGGLLNRAFGMGNKNVTETGIKGTISDSGVTGSNYSDWTQSGGWFRSNKSGEDSSALTADQTNSLGTGLTTMKSTVTNLAQVLGVGNEALNNYSKSFDILLTPLKQVTGDAAQQAQIVQENQQIAQQNATAITTFFTSVGDDMATKLIPNISSFAQAGETASQTLTRLNATFTLTNNIAGLLGKTVQQAFGGSGLSSDAVRESLVNLAGGSSNLQSYTQNYASNFLTNAQQLAPTLKAVSDAMGALGLSSITTRAQFAAEISSLDLTKTSDQQLFVSLMQLSSAFATVTPALDDATKSVQDIANERKSLQDQLDQLTMTSTQLLQKQRNALDDSNKALFDQVQAIQALKDASTALSSNVDDAFNVLQSVVNKQKDALTKAHDAQSKLLDQQITSQQTALDTAKSLADAFSSALDSLKDPSTSGALWQGAKGMLEKALGTAQAGGGLPTLDSMKDSLNTISQGPQTANYSSRFSYLQDLYSARNTLSILKNATGSGEDVQQKMLDALNAQKTAADDAYQAQSDALDNLVNNAQDQITEMKGQSTSLLSIDQAMHGVLLAIQGANGNALISGTQQINNAYQTSLGRAPDAAGMTYYQQSLTNGNSINDIVNSIKNSPEAQIQSLYQGLLGRSADAAGLQYYLNSGGSIDQIRASIMGSTEYKGLHSFDVGTNNVPYNMVAKLHEGEAVIPKADNRALRSAVSNNAASSMQVVTAIASLQKEMASFRQENKAGMVAMQRDTAVTANRLRKWDGNGMPAARDLTQGV